MTDRWRDPGAPDDERSHRRHEVTYGLRPGESDPRYADYGDDEDYPEHETETADEEYWTAADRREREQAWTAIIAVRGEMTQLDGRLGARPPAVGPSFDPDDERLGELRVELARLLPPWGEPPTDWKPPAAKPPPTKALDSFTERLQARLSGEQFRHWRWIEAGRKQDPIALDLGISQPAVVKRERKIRALANEVYREVYGRDYPWPGGPGKPRRQGARSGRL